MELDDREEIEKRKNSNLEKKLAGGVATISFCFSLIKSGLVAV